MERRAAGGHCSPSRLLAIMAVRIQVGLHQVRQRLRADKDQGKSHADVHKAKVPPTVFCIRLLNADHEPYRFKGGHWAQFEHLQISSLTGGSNATSKSAPQSDGEHTLEASSSSMLKP